MTPADEELWKKAEQAAWNYRKVYGVFPDKIGVHYRHTDFFYRTIKFPVMPPRLGVTAVAELTELASPMIRQHITTFAPVAGEGIGFSEVYVPAPMSENPNAVISGAQIAAIASKQEEKGHLSSEHVWPLTCDLLEEMGMWDTSGCCSSCHEDVEYGYPLCEHTLPDGRDIRVCCRCKPWDAKTEEDITLS